MPDENYDYDVVVIGDPNSPPGIGTSWMPEPFQPGGNANPANHPAIRFQREIQKFGEEVLKKEEDVLEDEIVVTGQRFRTAAVVLAGKAIGPKLAFRLPCFLENAQIDNINPFIMALRFNLTNKTFGPGRAGENLNKGGGTTPVNINIKQFNNYLGYETGAEYLVLHEVAHTFKAMRDFNDQMFKQFLAGAGKGLNSTEAAKQFAGTPEFVEVEKRANLIAKNLYNHLMDNSSEFSFKVTHGYAQC